MTTITMYTITIISIYSLTTTTTMTTLHPPLSCVHAHTSLACALCTSPKEEEDGSEEESIVDISIRDVIFIVVIVRAHSAMYAAGDCDMAVSTWR